MGHRVAVRHRWFAGFLLAGAGALAHAQQLPAAPTPATATLVGDVVDSHNGLVPGATVVATQKASAHATSTAATIDSAAHTVTSDSAGHFEISGLAPGVWTVEASAPTLDNFRAPSVDLKPGERHELEGVVLGVPEQHADVTVTLTVEQVAEQEIHDQEQQRALAIFPNFNTSYVWNAAPMNAKQKFKLSLRSTLDPISFATAGAVAGYQYGTNKYPEYGGGFEGYAQYYGAAFGTIFIGHTIGYALLPALLHQDPRYFYMGPGASNKTRAIHAIASSVLARGDSGHTQFNFSHIGGNFIAGYISRSYHPGDHKSFGLAIDNTVIGVVGQMGVNVVREFVLKKISTGTPKYGNGKPAGEAVHADHP